MFPQSEYSDSTQHGMIIPANLPSMVLECFQRTASEYRFPVDRLEAPAATSLRNGCCHQSLLGLLPQTKEAAGIQQSPFLEIGYGYPPQRFLTETWASHFECRASMAMSSPYAMLNEKMESR